MLQKSTGLLTLFAIFNLCAALRLQNPRSNLKGSSFVQKYKRNGRLPPYAEDDIHLVIPSDCTQMGTWQAELLAYSALKVGQQGKITRIATGCEQNKTDFAQIHRSLHPNLRVHVTPQYGTMEWPFIRKVNGLEHWLENADPPVTESVIVVFDADQMLMRKISPNGLLNGQPRHSEAELEKEGVIYGGNWNNFPKEGVVDLVRPGVVISQGYGQGVDWANKGSWKRKEIEKIVGADSLTFKTNPQGENGRIHYSVGFPAMLHISDAHNVFKTWSNFTEAIHENIDKKDNGWTADMTAWEVTLAHLGMTQNHLRLNNMMISNTNVGSGIMGEGFQLIDDWHRDTCKNGPWDNSDNRVPMVIHYCQGIPTADTWSFKSYPDLRFHKKLVSNSMLDCKAPMHVDAPANLKELDDGTVASSGPGKRVAWMSCAMMHAVTEMTAAYKEKFCEPGYNTQKVNPYVDNQRGSTSDSWGYPTQGQDRGSREGLKLAYKTQPMDQVSK